MERLIETDLEKLKTDALTAMRMAQIAVDKALTAVFGRDAAAAGAVIAGDEAIDAMEGAVDAESLRLLALHQPVAGDLRAIIGCMRAVGDIERIGDQAKGLAKRALLLLERQPAPPPASLRELAETTREFLVRTIACLTDLNADLARRLCQESQHTLALDTAILQEMTTTMRREARLMEWAVQICFIAHGLKRICDQCTNIAESVIFIREGANNRHRRYDALPV